jgi:hypothetical protein
MKWFRRLFKKKSYPQDSKFKLCIINDESDLIHEVLGITEERCQELAKICIEAYHASDIKTESYAIVVGKCNHINEVVMVMQMFERICELKNKKRKIMDMLDNMFGK